MLNLFHPRTTNLTPLRDDNSEVMIYVLHQRCSYRYSIVDSEMAHCYYCMWLQTDRRHYQRRYQRVSRSSTESCTGLSEFFGTEVNLQEQFRQDSVVCKICH